MTHLPAMNNGCEVEIVCKTTPRLNTMAVEAMMPHLRPRKSDVGAARRAPIKVPADLSTISLYMALWKIEKPLQDRDNQRVLRSRDLSVVSCCERFDEVRHDQYTTDDPLDHEVVSRH